MTNRPRDPDCTCEMVLPAMRRIWCEHCLTEGPMPGSLADPTINDEPREEQ